MDTRLQGRIAIITGSSSGIGRATALRFAASGARIVCADLRPDLPPSSPSSSPSVLNTDAEITRLHGPSRATFVRTDVTSESSVENLIRAAVAFGGEGRLDILCNYAGLQRDRHFPGARVHEMGVAEFDTTFAVNVRGTWLCCKHALAQMGTKAFPYTSTYVPSKFAVVGMTKQMALDYAEDRIHINCVCPGFVKTPMLEEFAATAEDQKPIADMHPWKALGEPGDVADAALFLCSDEAAWVTGHILHVDGGFAAQ